MRPSIRSTGCAVAVLAWVAVACGGPSGDTRPESPTGDAPATEIPTLGEIADVELEDHRPDLLAVFGPPQAFRITFVTVDGVTIRHDTWDYLELESRIDLIDGQIVLTSDLEPVPAGTWYPIHVDPSDSRSRTGTRVSVARPNRTRPSAPSCTASPSPGRSRAGRSE